MARRLISGSPQRELRRQQRLLVVLERRYRRRIASEIKRASRDILTEYKRTGSVPHEAEGHSQRMAAIYERMVSDSVQSFGGRVVQQGKSTGLALERKDFAAVFGQIAMDYVAGEMIRQRIVKVTDTTRANIVAQVMAGQAEGLGVAAIARNVAKAVPSIAIARGAIIARTETHGAANAGADEAARATGLKLRKEWVAVGGGRTRDDHADADGQIVDMDAPFYVGGERLRYPGDPAGSAGNIINCRCGVSHIVDDGIS